MHLDLLHDDVFLGWAGSCCRVDQIQPVCSSVARQETRIPDTESRNERRRGGQVIDFVLKRFRDPFAEAICVTFPHIMPPADSARLCNELASTYVTGHPVVVSSFLNDTSYYS